MQVIFWQGILSPHLAPIIRALADRSGWAVSVVAERLMTPDRSAIGWSVPDLGGARIVQTMNRRSVEKVVEDAGRDCIHVLQGISGCGLVTMCLPVLRRYGAHVGVLSESGADKGIGLLSDVGSALRRARCRLQAKRYGDDIEFILAMGQDGVTWFKSCDFAANRIFPFCYVTETPTESERDRGSQRDRSCVTVAFVGRLVWLKGGDLLIGALASLTGREWRLIMVGDGEAGSTWRKLARKLNIAERVSFTGTLPNSDARAMIGISDCLVFPTRCDGWGAVVNEALMQGVPVLCSDRCGARDLLSEDWRGELFEGGCIEGLREVLGRWIERGVRSEDATLRIAQWSRCIEGKSVADYFAAVLEHVYGGAPRPVAPWSRDNSEG